MTHRFINADGLVSTGTGILGHNMFAYCNNSPINRCDPTGYSWLSKAWESFTSWCSNTFGAGASSVITTEENEALLTPALFPVSITIGDYVAKTLSSIGDSSKTFSVYGEHNANDFVLSSAGINIYVDDFEGNFNLALDNLSGTFSIINGDTVESFSVKADFTSLKVGIEMSTSVIWDEEVETTYTNISCDMAILALLYGYSQSANGYYAGNYAQEYTGRHAFN